MPEPDTGRRSHRTARWGDSTFGMVFFIRNDTRFPLIVGSAALVRCPDAP